MCAVLPINCLIRSGSLMPGSCTTIRLCPCLGDLRIDHAGLVDAAADDLDRLLHRPAARAASAVADRVRVMVPSGSDPIAMSGCPVDASGLISGRSAATAASVLVASRSRSSTRFWSGCGSSVW